MSTNGFLRRGLPLIAHHNQECLSFLIKAAADPSLLRGSRHAGTMSYLQTFARNVGFTTNGVLPDAWRGARNRG